MDPISAAILLIAAGTLAMDFHKGRGVATRNSQARSIMGLPSTLQTPSPSFDLWEVVELPGHFALWDQGHEDRAFWGTTEQEWLAQPSLHVNDKRESAIDLLSRMLQAFHGLTPPFALEVHVTHYSVWTVLRLIFKHGKVTARLEVKTYEEWDWYLEDRYEVTMNDPVVRRSAQQLRERFRDHGWQLTKAGTYVLFDQTKRFKSDNFWGLMRQIHHFYVDTSNELTNTFYDEMDQFRTDLEEAGIYVP